MAKRWTNAEIDWLHAGYRRWRAPECAERMTALFGRTITATAVKSACQNRGIMGGHDGFGWPRGLAKGDPRARTVWTDAMLDWLREHRATGPGSEIFPAFREQFGPQWGDKAISQACRRYRIKAATDGKIRPGNRPWNAGLTGYQPGGRAAETQFRHGNRPHTWMPIGAYRQDTDGVWWLKYRDEGTAGESRHNWTEVHRLTYRDHIGDIPDGAVVVLLDGDNDNCLDPCNLACVTRAELVRANQLGLAQLTDAAQRVTLLAIARITTAAHDQAKGLGMDYTARRRLIGTLSPAAKVLEDGEIAPGETSSGALH